MNSKRIYLYGILGIGIIFIVFATYLSLFPRIDAVNRYTSIPERPSDFDAFTREIWSGGYTNLCNLPEEYWKQPEFYGSSWNIAKGKFYDNPNYELWGVYGHGNIPREVSFTFNNLKIGDEFESCSFFHNGFGVWTYQGFNLIPIENEYFEITITPNEFLTSPTFPSFENDWTRKITIKLEVIKQPPIGVYELGFKVDTPSEEFSRQQTSDVLFKEVDKEIYLKDCMKFLNDEERCNKLINLRQKKYVNGGTYQTSTNPYTLQVVVK